MYEIFIAYRSLPRDTIVQIRFETNGSVDAIFRYLVFRFYLLVWISLPSDYLSRAKSA